MEEVLKRKDEEETQKIFDAIHRNYRERQYMDKGRAYLQKKNAKKNKIKEALLDGFEQALQLLLIITICGIWLVIGLAIKC